VLDEEKGGDDDEEPCEELVGLERCHGCLLVAWVSFAD
jgi:hypothetical protein